MRCFETEAELVALIDGKVARARELAVHAHLETCATCRQRAETWSELVPLMRRLAPSPPSPMQARRMEIEIERLLRTRAPARREAPARAFAWAGLTAAVAIALVFGWRVRGDREAVRLRVDVVTVEGVARIGAKEVGQGGRLDGPGELSVDARGSVSLAVADASLKIQGPAGLALGGDRAHVALRLDRGALAASVAHRDPGTTFVVSTRDGRVEVRGTRFFVAADDAGTSVSVEEGRVAVFSRAGEERSVGKGERIALGAKGFTPWPVPPVRTVAPGLTSVDRDVRPCTSRAAGCEVARQARQAMRVGNAARALHLIEGALDGGDGCEGTPGSSSCGDELRYLRAETMRQQGRLGDAVAAYKALDHRGAPAAMRQNAFYAAAQLEQRMGRAAAARADFESALAAASAGALREESMLGAMDSAAAEGDTPGARSLAVRYLDAFPSGLGAARARALAAGSAGSPGPAR